MKKSKNSTRSSRKSKQDSNDYHQRIQNYKQDIDKIKSQVSQLQQKLDEQTDYDSAIDLTDDFFQDKYPTKVSKDIKPFSHEQRITRKGKEHSTKKKQIEAPEDEDFTKGGANIKTKSYQARQISPNTSIDHQKKKQKDDKKNDIETPSLENYNQILTDNKVLAHKIKNLLASNSNLDEENKSLKEKNDKLNQQNHDLNEQLTNTKTKLEKLEKYTKELKAQANQQNPNKRSTSSRSKSVNKIPVIIDTNQIKEKVNSKEVDLDKIVSLEDDTNEPNKNAKELKKKSDNNNNNNNLEKENKKLKGKISSLSEEIKQNENKIDQLTAENKELKNQLENAPKKLVETSSTKKLREADSLAIADLTDKIALLEEENRKLRSKGLSATSISIENQDLKKQLNKKQRSRPTDNEAIANLTEKISELTQENMDLKKSLISSRSLRSENDDLREKIDKLQDHKNLSDSYLSENSSTNDLQEKIASLTKENKELKSQVVISKSLERENAKIQNKYNSLVEAIQKIRPDQTAKKQIEKLKTTVDTLSKENNDLKSNSSLSPNNSIIKSIDSKKNGTENNNENEIKRLNEELTSSKNVIDRMEKEFALQKKDLKDHYDNLLKEITKDLQNKQNPKENQLNKKIKMLEQDLDNQKQLYNSLENVNTKLQDQITQSRANNLALIKQIEEMNKQIEQLSGNTSSFQFSDQSDLEKCQNNKNNNIEYDQIKTDLVQIHKALNEVPDSSDSCSSKMNQFKFSSPQASSSSSQLKNIQKDANEITKQEEEYKKNSPSSKRKNNHDSNDTKNKYPYQSLNNNEDADADADDEDAFLNDNNENILSDTGNDTENDDINALLNDNFTDSDPEVVNTNTINKNAILIDSDNNSNSNNSFNNDIKSPKKKKSLSSPIDLDALLNTSGADLNGMSTSEAFKQLVESIDQSRGEILMNTEEEYEKLKANLSLEDSLSLDEKNKSKEKSPKKTKKIKYLLLDEEIDDDKTFSG